MTKKEKERIREICHILNQTYGTDFKCYLNHDNAWQLLIATMLSAQCTDARVNIVTKDLFVKYPSLSAFANADVKDWSRTYIRPDFIKIRRKILLAVQRNWWRSMAAKFHRM